MKGRGLEEQRAGGGGGVFRGGHRGGGRLILGGAGVRMDGRDLSWERPTLVLT